MSSGESTAEGKQPNTETLCPPPPPHTHITKTRSGPRRVRMSSGERPIGTANGKQPNIEALCHPPPPPPGLRCCRPPPPPTTPAPSCVWNEGDVSGGFGAMRHAIVDHYDIAISPPLPPGLPLNAKTVRSSPPPSPTPPKGAKQICSRFPL